MTSATVGSLQHPVFASMSTLRTATYEWKPLERQSSAS
jgi:hypothetical protein